MTRLRGSNHWDRFDDTSPNYPVCRKTSPAARHGQISIVNWRWSCQRQSDRGCFSLQKWRSLHFKP